MRVTGTGRRGRYWKITNPNKRNEVGNPVAYKLTPPRDVVPVMVQEAPTSTTARGSSSTTCG